MHARFAGRNGARPARVAREDGFEALLGWENMEDAKKKLQAHGPQAAHNNQVFERVAAPAPTARARYHGAEIVKRQKDSIDESDLATLTNTPIASEIATHSGSLQTAAPTTSTAPKSSTATTPTSTPEPAPATDDGVGMKAGIALGVLGGVFIIFLIVYFILRSRRKAQEKKRQDEKRLSADELAERRASTKTSATAPRLSLRPVTQFLPLMGHKDGNTTTFPDRRTSREAAVQLTTGASTAKALPKAPGSTGSRNPFRDSAERPTTPRSRNDDYDAAPVSPVSESSEVGSMVSRDLPSPPGSPGLTTSSMVRSTSVRKNAPQALDLTLPPPKKLPAVPPSPTGTEYSMHSMAPGAVAGPSKGAAAIADAGGPASSSVHRVQLDFKPTLDDELGLKAGQLVRLLHEYDDGWALCIRLDRSRQGVVPRTCLSTRPVKPRPNPAGMRGPPVNPSSSRPQSPMKPPGSAKSAPGTAY